MSRTIKRKNAYNRHLYVPTAEELTRVNHQYVSWGNAEPRLIADLKRYGVNTVEEVIIRKAVKFHFKHKRNWGLVRYARKSCNDLAKNRNKQLLWKAVKYDLYDETAWDISVIGWEWF